MRKLFYIVFSVFIFASCATDETRHSEKVVRRHDNNSPWIVFCYDVTGKDSVWVSEKWFHDNGVLNLEGPIVNGKREGHFKGYYPSGKLMSEGDFKNGLREGRGVVYHENGSVSIEGDYREGDPAGIWTFYNEEGEIIDVHDFQ
ncbi:MAG: hypothetical protein Q4F69_06840 [Bacteroidia bacterium]|nr:hypothetical protein [Bacteroidia bacterium]